MLGAELTTSCSITSLSGPKRNMENDSGTTVCYGPARPPDGPGPARSSRSGIAAGPAAPAGTYPEQAADQVGDPGGCQRPTEVSVNLDSPLMGCSGCLSIFAQGAKERSGSPTYDGKITRR
jgi:hypothetical protein